MANRCAKCHDAAVTEKDGGGFKMFEKGAMLKLTQRQADNCFKKIVKGEMPKNDKLSDQDGRAMLEFFDKYKVE